MSLSRRGFITRLAPRLPDDGSRYGEVEQNGSHSSKPVRINFNENPQGPGKHALDAIVGKFPEAGRYPFNSNPAEGALPAAIARKNNAKAENVVVGAGSGEILVNAVRAFTSPSKPLVTAWPSFATCHETAQKIGTPIREVALDSELRIDLAKMLEASKGAGLVFLCNPNNPTATVHGAKAIEEFVTAVRKASPDTVILLDEAYHDYVTDPSYKSGIPMALTTPNVFVARTFSKAYGMAGMRVGYAIGHAEAIRQLARYRMPYGTTVPAIAAAVTALDNDAYITAERDRNTEVRNFTLKAFESMGYKATPSQGNFIFVDLKRPAKAFRDACAQHGVVVGRDFPPYEKTHCRISLGTMDEMQRAVAVFRQVLGAPSTTTSQKQ